jgi:ATP-binding cassette subfamily B protein RaxB
MKMNENSNRFERKLFSDGYQVSKKNLVKMSDLKNNYQNYLDYQEKYWELGASDANHLQIWSDDEGIKEIPIQDIKGQEIIQVSKRKSLDIFENVFDDLKQWILDNKKLAFNFLLIFILFEMISLLEPIILNIALSHLEFFSYTQEWLVPLGLGFLVIMAGMVIEYIKQQNTLLYTGKLAVQVSKNLWQKFLLQDKAFLATFLPNDFYTRMYAMEQVFYRLIQQILSIFQDGLFFVMHLLVMFVFSWQLSLVEVFFMGLIASTHGFFLVQYFNQSKKLAEQQQTHLSFFLEIFQNLLAIKVFKKEWRFWQLWQLKMMPYWQTFLKNDFFQSKVMISIEILRKINGLLILFMGLYLIYKQQMQLGTFIAFLALKAQVTGRFEGVFKRLMQWQYLKAPVIRMQELFDKITSQVPQKAIADFKLNKVCYLAHKTLSKTFFAGKKYLIKGPSGCGKTSLLKCLLGIKKPLSGQIDLPEKVAAILQTDSLLTGTIQENITFFATNVDEELLQEVADLVDIAHPMMSMVTNLSQGEQQRVLIARALYTKPDWLILDEATCHLDEKAEHQLIQNLLAMPHGLIMVSHHPDMGQGFDECFELN